jgi:hypothetical protein
MYKFFIPGNVPSLKNSKIKTSRGIFPSKTVVSYLKNLGIKRYSVRDKVVEEYVRRENLFKKYLATFPTELEYPIHMGFHFIRKSKRDFDFNNATQIIQDLLVAHNYIEDDSMRFLLPYPLQIEGLYYSINPKNPGVILKVDYDRR